MLIHKTNQCLICNSNRLVEYLDLGVSALANSYLSEEQLDLPEPKYPLRVSFCEDCYLAQLTDIVDRNALFENYAYFSSTSPQLHSHFQKYAQVVFDKYPEQTKKFTVEIASNDGILLKPFKALGARILGIDPAKNIAEQAALEGIETLPLFFDETVADEIATKYGRAGIISANNVLAHTDNLHGIISGVKKLLAPDGVFVFEVQYLADLIEHNEFDNTYHEHICYFSLSPLITLMQMHGLQIFDVEHVETQGGSLRVYAGHSPAIFAVSENVQKILDAEKANKLNDVQTYLEFAKNPLGMRVDLKALLAKIKSEGKKIVGYGAPAKGNTLLQFCGLGTETFDYITDNAPSKQGKFTPGSHIPIVSPEILKTDRPDVVVILAWNYADDILVREKGLLESGVIFIKPVPKVEVIERKAVLA